MQRNLLFTFFMLLVSFCMADRKGTNHFGDKHLIFTINFKRNVILKAVIVLWISKLILYCKKMKQQHHVLTQDSWVGRWTCKAESFKPTKEITDISVAMLSFISRFILLFKAKMQRFIRLDKYSIYLNFRFWK